MSESCPVVHCFKPIGPYYYKRDGKMNPPNTPSHDRSVEYTMLFCPMCGETKEIISADHRKPDDAEESANG